MNDIAIKSYDIKKDEQMLLDCKEDDNIEPVYPRMDPFFQDNIRVKVK